MRKLIINLFTMKYFIICLIIHCVSVVLSVAATQPRLISVVPGVGSDSIPYTINIYIAVKKSNTDITKKSNVELWSKNDDKKLEPDKNNDNGYVYDYAPEKSKSSTSKFKLIINMLEPNSIADVNIKIEQKGEFTLYVDGILIDEKTNIWNIKFKQDYANKIENEIVTNNIGTINTDESTKLDTMPIGYAVIILIITMIVFFSIIFIQQQKNENQHAFIKKIGEMLYDEISIFEKYEKKKNNISEANSLTTLNLRCKFRHNNICSNNNVDLSFLSKIVSCLINPVSDSEEADSNKEIKFNIFNRILKILNVTKCDDTEQLSSLFFQKQDSTNNTTTDFLKYLLETVKNESNLLDESNEAIKPITNNEDINPITNNEVKTTGTLFHNLDFNKQIDELLIILTGHQLYSNSSKLISIGHITEILKKLKELTPDSPNDRVKHKYDYYLEKLLKNNDMHTMMHFFVLDVTKKYNLNIFDKDELIQKIEKSIQIENDWISCNILINKNVNYKDVTSIKEFYKKVTVEINTLTANSKRFEEENDEYRKLISEEKIKIQSLQDKIKESENKTQTNDQRYAKLYLTYEQINEINNENKKISQLIQHALNFSSNINSYYKNESVFFAVYYLMFFNIVNLSKIINDIDWPNNKYAMKAIPVFKFNIIKLIDRNYDDNNLDEIVKSILKTTQSIGSSYGAHTWAEDELLVPPGTNKMPYHDDICNAMEIINSETRRHHHPLFLNFNLEIVDNDIYIANA